MKARKAVGWLIFGLVMFMVVGFLALHTLNLFTFVFPPEQSQWAWLGFGFTSLGAIGYLLSFLWLSKTTTQKVIAVVMAFISFVAEAVSAFFGMQVETYKKIGFSFTEQDINTILTVIGILGVLHFFALIGHFAGDKIIELFGDHDGDGTPNYSDPDYLEWKKARNLPPQKPASPPANTNGASVKLRAYTITELLNHLQMSREDFAEYLQACGGNVYTAWAALDKQGSLPADMGMKNFSDLARAVLHSVNPTSGAA